MAENGVSGIERIIERRGNATAAKLANGREGASEGIPGMRGR